MTPDGHRNQKRSHDNQTQQEGQRQRQTIIAFPYPAMLLCFPQFQCPFAFLLVGQTEERIIKFPSHVILLPLTSSWSIPSQSPPELANHAHTQAPPEESDVRPSDTPYTRHATRRNQWAGLLRPSHPTNSRSWA